MIEVRADLPEAVIGLALRCGARHDDGGRTVVLGQSGFMKGGPGARPLSFTAAETIQLQCTEFVWTARCEPMKLLVVRDELVGERGRLSLLAFGAVPLSTTRSDRQVTRGEIMRYLGELPWAPDAILHNHDLSWRVIDQRTLAVAAGEEAVRGEVLLRLGDNGLVCAIEADGRPRKEEAGFVDRPWRGRFSAYHERQGRLVPGRGEASWLLGGAPFDCWVGELRNWRIQ